MLSPLPLSYCTNVHPGRNVAEVLEGLELYTVPVRNAYGGELAAGLWLANSVIRELSQDAGLQEKFAVRLARMELTCHTLNAFPFGDFHEDRVKEQVYVPDWSRSERLQYTEGCARILAGLLPDGTEGSISTVPLGFKGFDHPQDFSKRCVANLISLSQELDRLRERTGRLIRLAIEPEPLCLLETTPETLQFFQELWDVASAEGALPLVQEHIGVCFDVCHQAVEFEDVADSIRSLEHAGIRINKVHITCALELNSPRENVEGRRALARYVEQRYLHQTIARSASGQLSRFLDLTEALAIEPEPAFLDAERWRIHFHVPVDAEQLGPLDTTRADLRRALAAVAALPYSPHLEVETYTWTVLPDGQQQNLVDGLTRELNATRDLLGELGD